MNTRQIVTASAGPPNKRKASHVATSLWLPPASPSDTPMNDKGGGRLAGRVAIVTGATSGIGRASALALAGEGARVVVAGRRRRLGAELAREIRSADGDALFVRTDVSKRVDVVRLVERSVDTFGRVDIVVNNAAVFDYHSVEETPEAVWDAVLATNLGSVYLVSKYSIPHLRRSGGGSIINVASVHALATGPHLAAYAASKGGVLALSRQMALDLAQDRIRVNALIVGSVDTDMSRSHGRAMGMDDAAIDSRMDDRAIGRMARPEEVARAVVFLASDDSSFVTGSPLIVDGGLLARLG